MHEIYMLAVLFNTSRPRGDLPTRDQRLRDEQAFYDRHGGIRWPRFRMPAGFPPALPVIVVALGLVRGLTHLLR